MTAIYTSAHRIYTGPGRVSISRSARGCPGGFRVYSKLAPSKELLQAAHRGLSRAEYERRYLAELAPLDPATVVAELAALANGHPPVMLCHEIPPWTESNYCHRRMAAAWLGSPLGIEIPELPVCQIQCDDEEPGNVTTICGWQPVQDASGTDLRLELITIGDALTLFDSVGEPYTARRLT